MSSGRGSATQAIHALAQSAMRSSLRQLRVSYDWRARLDGVRDSYLDRPVPVVLATITGKVDFPGIVPMLTGFLTRVGRPERIVVVDDGKLRPSERECILSISPLVEFVVPTIDPALPGADELRAYGELDAMGKKLALLIALTTNGDHPVAYVDTDVWFSMNCQPYVDLLTGDITHPWFMEDTSEISLDSRVLPESQPHVNSGFLVLPPSIDWTDALTSSRELIAVPEWFTEQTVVHRALHQHGARILPPEKFVLAWDDQYSPHDRVHERQVAVRHYVNPVRHKYWVMAHGGYTRSVRAMIRQAVRRDPEPLQPSSSSDDGEPSAAAS